MDAIRNLQIGGVLGIGIDAASLTVANTALSLDIGVVG